MRFTIASLVLSLVLASWAAGAGAADGQSAEAAFARRLCDMAQESLRVPSPGAMHLRQSAALLEAAQASDPTEPRYAVLLADALGRLGDDAGALGAWQAYRKLRPADQGAQLEVIGLYLKRIESLDRKIAYLNDLLGRGEVPAEVRSALAVRCAVLLLEGGKEQQAKEMTERALQLNKLNLAALALKWRWMGDAPAAEQAGLLLAMLRSNPAQPQVVARLAHLSAQAGLVKEALNWYAIAAMMQQPVAVEYAVQLYLDGQSAEAGRLLSEVIAAAPDHYPALTVRLLIERGSRNPDVALIERLRSQARNCLVNRLAAARKELGVVDATTRPVTEASGPLPDLGGDVQRWSASENAELKREYLSALAELTFFELYFNDRPEEARKLLRHYSQLAGEGDAIGARLAGWLFLAEKKKAEAKVKLSAAAGAADPLGELGLIKAMSGGSEQERGEAVARAQRLLSGHSAGPLGALIYEAVAELGVKPAAGAEAAGIRAQIGGFPGGLMNILTRPQLFYSVRVEPLKTTFGFGEAMLVRLTVQNTGEHELTVGDEGVIKRDVIISAQLQGASQQVFPAVCVERLTDALVLKPRQAITRVVRVDQGELALYLKQNPVTAIMLTASAQTNPGGPCGLVATSSRLMERSGFAATEGNIRKVIALLSSGSGQEKLGSLDLLAVLSYSLVVQKDLPYKAVAPEMAIAIQQAQRDGSAAVAAYAALQKLLVWPLEEQAAIVERMLSEPAWQTRLMGLGVLANAGPKHPIGPERRRALLEEAARSAGERFVRGYASASLEVMAMPAATQPASGGELRR